MSPASPKQSDLSLTIVGACRWDPLFLGNDAEQANGKASWWNWAADQTRGQARFQPLPAVGTKTGVPRLPACPTTRNRPPPAPFKDLGVGGGKNGGEGLAAIPPPEASVRGVP